jgi:hypothetical protein
MPRLTAKEKRRLTLTGNLVRMYVATITFVFPVLCVVLANEHYRKIEAARVPPEIPRAATYGTITGIYLPLFAATAAYVWATRASAPRSLAPHGFGMALFRDVFTVGVITTLLYVPVHLYALPGTTLQWIAPILIWYQTILTAGAGAAFTYYFRASIVPLAKTEPESDRRAVARTAV